MHSFLMDEHTKKMIEEEHKIAFGKERTIISGIFILCIDIYLFFLVHSRKSHENMQKRFQYENLFDLEYFFSSTFFWV